MATISGQVEVKAATGKMAGKSIKVGEYWYTVKFPSALAGIEKGDYVTFDYTTNGTFNNITGKPVKSTPPASTPVKAFSGASYGSSTARVFPVPALAPERSIIRQNSLTHALNVLQARAYWEHVTSCEEYANAAIDVARMFEAYSAGDLDAEMVEAEVALMLAKEAH